MLKDYDSAIFSMGVMFKICNVANFKKKFNCNGYAWLQIQLHKYACCTTSVLDCITYLFDKDDKAYYKW